MYQYDIAQWIEFLDLNGIHRPGRIKTDHITTYLAQRRADGRSDATIHRNFVSIKMFCKHMRKTGKIKQDITEDLRTPNVRQEAPRIPTVQEVERIIAQTDTDTETGTRDRAILELLYSSGLRATELCDLKLSDFDSKSIQVSCGKRGKARSVPMTTQAIEWVNKYIDTYRGKDAGLLFKTVLGKRIGRHVLYQIVHGYAVKAGVEGVSPHTLRHACATHLLNAGGELPFIQKILGHSSIVSTSRYTHLSSGRMEIMFQEFHPRKMLENLEKTI